MIEFTCSLERRIKLKAHDPGIADTEWVLELSEKGVRMHRLGESKSWFVTWRSVLGYALIHSAGKQEA